MKKLLIKSIIVMSGVGIGMFISTKLQILMNLNSIDNSIIAENENIINETNTDKYRSDLILVNKYLDSVIVDLKYASNDNILGEKLYSSNLCYLQKNTAEKLKKANEELMSKGYRLKIWDAYRPLSLQKIIWSKYPDATYVDNPFLGGSDNNKGVAVAVTMVSLNGDEIEFPYGFDDFNIRKTGKYSDDIELTERIILLTEVMENNGFYSSGEMWYNFVDTESYNYEVLDISFRDLLKK